MTSLGLSVRNLDELKDGIVILKVIEIYIQMNDKSDILLPLLLLLSLLTSSLSTLTNQLDQIDVG